MSGNTHQDHYHQLNSAMSDKNIEDIMRDSERDNENLFCLDEDTFELDQDTFYVEVTHKKKCLNGLD